MLIVEFKLFAVSSSGTAAASGRDPSRHSGVPAHDGCSGQLQRIEKRQLSKRSSRGFLWSMLTILLAFPGSRLLSYWAGCSMLWFPLIGFRGLWSAEPIPWIALSPLIETRESYA